MNDKKRFYWIKLKTDFFNRSDIDFLLSQENGCQYVVLYQMLCLNTANTNGLLENKINEVIIPYDIKKIVRDTKYFDYDTVAIALELFKKLGLIYEELDNTLRIANFEEMVGSEAGNANAQRQKRYRERQKQIKLQSVTLGVTENNEEYRDKSIEYRDKSIDKNSIDKNSIVKRASKNFIKPTVEEITNYCLERNNGINAEAFYDFYESKDWQIGKNKMKDWKACVRTWEKRTQDTSTKKESKAERYLRERDELLREEMDNGKGRSD